MHRGRKRPPRTSLLIPSLLAAFPPCRYHPVGFAIEAGGAFSQCGGGDCPEVEGRQYLQYFAAGTESWVDPNDSLDFGLDGCAHPLILRPSSLTRLALTLFSPRCAPLAR